MGIKELQVDRVEWQEQRLHLYCRSVFEEAIGRHGLNKRQVVNPTYERQFRDLPITGKEVYLHVQQRQFYCPDGDRYFNERFRFFDPKRTMTRRYERYVYECCKASTIRKIRVQENPAGAASRPATPQTQNSSPPPSIFVASLSGLESRDYTMNL